jgi:hypothetical protein
LSNCDDIEKQLLERANGASVEQLGTIAAAMKAVADTKSTELMTRNKAREIRLELFKSAAAFLVPVVSLLALFGTIVAQNKQIEASRQQIEDTEWRDLLGSLKGASDAVYSDPTVAPRLRSFFASVSYGDQAKSIAGRLMGHISNPEGFADLFTAVFGEIDRQNIGSVLDVFRALLISKQSLHYQCNDLLISSKVPYEPGLADCAAYTDDTHAAQLIDRFKVDAKFASLRRSDGQLSREMGVVDQRIVSFLRANYRIPRDRHDMPGLDLSGTDFLDADFSQLDFTGFDITGTIFDRTNFSNAILNPKTRTELGQPVGSAAFAEQPDFRASTWWEAQSVEPNLLTFLMNWYFPYLVPNVIYPLGYRITREAYQAKVAALCTKAGIACPPQLKFGSPPANVPN